MWATPCICEEFSQERVTTVSFNQLRAKSAHWRELVAVYPGQWWHTLLGRGLPRLMSAATTEGSPDGISSHISVTKVSLRVGRHLLHSGLVWPGLAWRGMGSARSILSKTHYSWLNTYWGMCRELVRCSTGHDHTWSCEGWRWWLLLQTFNQC